MGRNVGQHSPVTLSFVSRKLEIKASLLNRHNRSMMKVGEASPRLIRQRETVRVLHQQLLLSFPKGGGSY